MDPKNIQEYKLIRQEMITVKDCITKYIGFVLGGSGIAVYGIAHGAPNLGKFGYFATFIICFSLSTIINLVLLILFYKFSSHNRFAGYCKLLNHELHHMKQPTHATATNQTSQTNQPVISRKPSACFAWEVAVDRLRYWKIRKNKLMSMRDAEIIGIDFSKLKEVVFSLISQDESPRSGFKILISALLGNVETRSWAFPPLVVATLFILSSSFFIGGLIFSFILIQDKNTIAITNILQTSAIVITTLMVISFVYLWVRCLGKLHKLLKCGSTVESFFWKFMPIRASFLNQQDIVPEYIDTDIYEIRKYLNKYCPDKEG